MSDSSSAPTPATIRAFLRAHGLTGAAAAEAAGLSGGQAIRKYTGGAHPHRMSYAVWFTLHAKMLLTPAQLVEIEQSMRRIAADALAE